MTQATALAKREVQAKIEAYRPQLEMALPRHVSVDSFTRSCLTAISKNPRLAMCGPSLFGAIIEASSLGLMADGRLGHAYIVPYKNEAKLIIGYRGMIELARRSGEIKAIRSRLVDEADEFTWELGLREDIVHRPAASPGGKITHVYAVAEFTGGGYHLEVMSTGQINEIRSRSKVRGGPWETDWGEMARKTVIRRLFKYLPCSTELSRAVQLDEYAEAGVSQQFVIGDEHDRYGEIDADSTRVDSHALPGGDPSGEGDSRGDGVGEPAMGEADTGPSG